MKYPKIQFSYDIEKDVDNVLIGFKIVQNGQNPDVLLRQIIDKFGESPSREQITGFIKEIWKDKEDIKVEIIEHLKKHWNKINDIYFERLFRYIKITHQEEQTIPGFASSRYGSGYSVPEWWFAVSLRNGTMRNTTTAMHEIMHLFFHKYWWQKCLQIGLTDKQTWDVKEAVTVLINAWCGDLITELDWGYPEHAELRRFIIKQWWPETKDFGKIIERSCEYMRINENKSPTWNK